MKFRFAQTRFLVLAALSVGAVSTTFAQVPQEAEQPTERFWHRRLPDGARQILVLHGEPDGRAIADLFQVPVDGMQDRVWTREYASFEAAQKDLPAITANFQSTTGTLMREAGRAARTTEVAGSRLWTATQSWNADWEKRYAEWIRTSLTKDFYSRYGIATDCADVAYISRWIFARMNGLPAGNHLGGTAALFTQDSFRREWSALKPATEWHKDQRFRAAIRYLQDQTYTHTLLRDSYPVAVTLETLRPGGYHLRLHGTSGHTQVVRRIDPQADEPLLLTQSTLPVAVRDLFETGLWNSEVPKESDGGFLSMRWTERGPGGWTMRAASAMPGYSKEQYTAAFIDGRGYDEAILAHLHPDLDYRARIRDGMKTLKEQLTVRIGIVENGHAFCASHDCRPDSQAYDDWSTPSRDKALRELVTRLEELYLRMLRKQDAASKSIQDEWRKLLREEFATIEGKSYTVGAFAAAMRRGSASSDPRESVAKRWTLDVPSLAAFYEKSLTENLRTRESTILGQASACRPAATCAPGAAGWTRWNTYDLDETLRTLFREVDLYCAFSSVADCDAFRTALQAKSVAVAGLNLSLWEWLTRSLFLVSDPREDVAVRWGAGAEKLEARAWRNATNVMRSRDGLIYGSIQGVPRFGDIRSLRSFNMPVGDADRRWNAFDVESGYMAEVAKLEPGKVRVRVQNPAVGYIYTHVFEDAAFDGEGRVLLTWMADRVLLMQARPSGQLLIADFRDTTPLEYKQYTAGKDASAYDLVAPGRIVIQKSGGGVVMLDARENPLRETALSFPAGYAIGANIVETDTHLVNAGYQCTSPSDCRSVMLVVDKARGQVKAVNAFPGENLWMAFYPSTGGRKIIVRTFGQGGPVGHSLKVIELGPTFDLVQVRPLGAGTDVHIEDDRCSAESGIVAWSAASTLHVSRLTDEGLQELGVRSDEKRSLGICRGRVQFELQGGMQRIREASGTGSVWAEAPELQLGEQGYLERLVAGGEPSVYREFTDAQTPRTLMSLKVPVSTPSFMVWSLIRPKEASAAARDTVVHMGPSLLWIAPKN